MSPGDTRISFSCLEPDGDMLKTQEETKALVLDSTFKGLREPFKGSPKGTKIFSKTISIFNPIPPQ